MNLTGGKQRAKLLAIVAAFYLFELNTASGCLQPQEKTISSKQRILKLTAQFLPPTEKFRWRKL
jgi:hypothetical protein